MLSQTRIGYTLLLTLLLCPCLQTLAQDTPPAEQQLELSQYVEIQAGDLPIILSAPHGGNRDLPGVPARKGEGLETGASGFFTGRDSGTEELAHAVADAIESQFGKRPYLVISRTHRRFLDPNRPADIAYENAKVKPIYDHYHATIADYCKQITTRFHGGILLDIHGQGSKRDTVFRGTKNGLTVSNLRERFGELAHAGPHSLFGLLQSRGWTVHPVDLTGSDLNGKEQAGFTGGYIVQTYGSHKTLTVDAMQLEFGAEYRVAGRRVQTAKVLADALAEYATTYLKLKVPFDAEQVRPLKTDAQSIRVAVFVDEGVSSTVKLFDVLSSDPSLSATKVSAEDVRAGKLEQFSVLIHPGGSGSKQGKALGEQGRDKVRKFVQAGGGFVGICAGAYLAAGERDWSLGVLDAKVVDREHWNRGFGNVTIAMSPQGIETLSATGTKPEVYYHQGPLLAPGNDPNVPDFQSLATFETEIAKNGAPTGVMQGTTAIAVGDFGKGHVICFSPHPEKTAGLEGMVLKGIHRVAKTEPLSPNAQTSTTFNGKHGNWHGFKSVEIRVNERPVTVVIPEKSANSAQHPWVWHGEFFGHRPQPDIELLKRGFHIVYTSVPDLLGCPKAVAHWDKVYEELTTKHNFAPKVALVGLSRGGLYCYNWAASNPQRVACIYGDAPVCDLKSWPGGKGKGKGSPRDWELAKQCYSFANEDEAMAYKGNPVDNLAGLAEHKVVLLHVYGDADDVVPWEENTGLIASRYRDLGGEIQLIPKPGVGHHPHGLEDSTPIIEFIESNVLKQFEKK